jgi:hypothetical protein
MEQTGRLERRVEHASYNSYSINTESDAADALSVADLGCRRR